MTERRSEEQAPQAEPEAVPQVSVTAHFERFPATVKGAFVVRGEDPDPHQVRIASARCRSLDHTSERTIDVEPVTLDVAPHVNVFVPFELPVADLGPGWYELICEAKVDGTEATFEGGRRFVVSWPRGAVRRGHVAVGKQLRVDDGRIEVHHVDLAGDSIRVRVEPGDAAPLRLFADGAPLPVLEVETDERGQRVVSAYPVLRTQATLRIETDAPDPDGIDVALT